MMDVSERELITVTIPQYHLRKEVSSGGVRSFAKNGSWVYYHQYVTRLVENPDTKEKRMGRIFHLAMEDPKNWKDAVTIVPERLEDDAALQKCREEFEGKSSKASWDPGTRLDLKVPFHRRWHELKQQEAEFAGQEWVDEERFKDIIGEIDAVYKNPATREYICQGGATEQAGLATCDKSGLRLKALADILFPGECVVDFKTTRRTTIQGFKYDALRVLSYQYQLEHYCRVFGVQKAVLITVTNQPQFEAMVYSFSYQDFCDAASPFATVQVSDGQHEALSVKDCNQYVLQQIAMRERMDDWHADGWGSEIDLREFFRGAESP